MSEITGISWTDHTFNPWIGCSKVSPGCKNCYAETLDNRYYGGAHWGKGAPRKRTCESTWNNPVKWDKHSRICFENDNKPLPEGFKRNPNYEYHRPRVFPSLCDWLDEEVPIEWLADFLKLIHDTPNLDWLLLTKRPENFFPMTDKLADYGHEVEDWLQDWAEGKGPPNIWVGVSVEDQKRADERIPLLLQIPAKVHFVSAEPLLERIDFSKWFGGQS